MNYTATAIIHNKKHQKNLNQNDLLGFKNINMMTLFFESWKTPRGKFVTFFISIQMICFQVVGVKKLHCLVKICNIYM